MSAEAELRGRFASRALEPETLFLLNPADGMEFLECAMASGLRVCGVEGFAISDSGAYEPRQDFSSDVADCPVSYEVFLSETIGLVEKGKDWVFASK